MASPESSTWTAPLAGNLDLAEKLPDKINAINYFRRFGYLTTEVEAQAVDLTPIIKAFQKSGGLPQTGAFDQATAELMKKPICGYAEKETGGGPLGFTTFGSKWDHTGLTWRVDSWSNKISAADALTAFRSAFARWAQITPLTFIEVRAGQAADIRIRFARRDHGDGNSFDGAGTVLAHAYSPGNGPDNIGGDAHFDEDEGWSLDFLSKVGLHEFGHAIGLGHSDDATAVMYRFFNNQAELQPDDIRGVQNLYGPRRSGWFSFNVDAGNTVAQGSDFAAVSRIPNSMEVWWIAPNGAVEDAYWYEGGTWNRFQLAPPGSAAPGGILALSRIPGSMEIWWISPTGAVEGAYWYEGRSWQRYQLAPPGSAAPGSKITGVSRIPTSMEIWWVAGNGSVQGAYWYAGGNWTRYQLAPDGSAALRGGIKATSRIKSSMELWWVAPNGSVQDAYWYEGGTWNRFQLAPAGSAAVTSGIAATTRIPGSMEIWWVAPNGSVQDAYWYEGGNWNRFELAPSASAALGGIEAVSRIPGSMEIWWTGTDGSVQDAYWYEGSNWSRFQLASPGSARAGTDFAATARVSNSMEIWCATTSGQAKDHYWYA
ncbi:Matrixin-domain-containing protein [Lasiosphaeris hirsuta]|uniref:Matrixin-domain-containing protein n=1 Tax=Lasiosphaeris hirsuta TaxID=260670 RepID=A0AA40A9X4_9PEZI|nr:Matrixin-domain-containing protein [Lasiosphaeris hirsuta]